MNATDALTSLDYAVCALYFAAIMAIGALFFRKRHTARDFFLAGRTMRWLPLGLSLMVTLASSIGFVGAPTASFRTGVLMLWSLLAIPLAFPVVVWVFIPFYHRLNVYTAYEYLERRFDLRVRLLTSGLFILWRVTWMAATIYVAAMVFQVASGGDISLVAAILVLGLLAILYTTFGGIKAVIWTDVAQFFVMFGGIAAAVALILHRVPGGLEGIWTVAAAAGKTHPTAVLPGWESAGTAERVRLYVYTDFTVLAILVSFTLDKLGNYCVDQAMVQRYLSARSLRDARAGFTLNCVTFALFFALMTFIGIALFAFRKEAPFPAGLKPDQIFPYFIAHFLPPGITGLMLSALIAAAMSSVDSGINSCVTAVSNDFHNRLWRHHANLDEEGAGAGPASMPVAQVSSVLLGALVLLMACYVGRMGDVFQIALKVVNSYLGPLFGVFFLAMFTKRANAFGAFWGGVSAVVLTAAIVFAENLHAWLSAHHPAAHTLLAVVDALDVGFLWVSAVGFAVTLAVGYLLSLLSANSGRGNTEWTFRAVMGRAEAAAQAK